jgi:hypothetical protein
MGWVVNATSWPLTPQEETWYQFYRRLCGPQAGLDRCGKCHHPHSDLIPREFHPWQAVILPSPCWLTLAGEYQIVMKMICACNLTTDYFDRGGFGVCRVTYNTIKANEFSTYILKYHVAYIHQITKPGTKKITASCLNVQLKWCILTFKKQDCCNSTNK